MKNILMAFGLALITLTSYSQSTVLDIIVNSEDHTLLEAAVVSAGLVDALSDTSGTFTVFAPVDGAVYMFVNELGITVDSLLNLPTLSDILLYHVIGTEVSSEELIEGGTGMNTVATTLTGEDVEFTIEGETIFVNGHQVIVTDLFGSNGVVHVIDAVLLDNTTNSVGEIQPTDVKYDGFYYNIMGQRFNSLRDVPFGTVYMYNGRKFIRTEN